MANIVQAAKWMQEGKKVKRHIWAVNFVKKEGAGFIVHQDGVLMDLWVYELLAEDWEIVEEKEPQ